ncbi:MAG: mechanosensitive ion channel protein MscS [Planctomyces sp.]|nr:mechanosensitive ion channel protein MscS [Planctomyces sp.]
MTVREGSAFNYQLALNHVWASLLGLWEDFLNRLPLLIVGLLVLILTAGVVRVATGIVWRSAKRARIRNSLNDLFVQLTTFFTWVIGIMIAAIIIFPGMTPAKLLTVLGLGSVALGFAFKDIFENFFAGILILWRFPFDRGDFIECEDIQGSVEDITIRMTTIRQVDGQLVVAPNAMLFKNSVNILTNRKLRRTTIICGVAYGEDVDESRAVIEAAVRDCTTVATEEPVEIFAQEFASSSINFEVTWWTGSTPLDVRRSRDEVVAKVKRRLDEAGIEIPFPYRTLTFKESLPLIRGAGSKRESSNRDE